MLRDALSQRLGASRVLIAGDEVASPMRTSPWNSWRWILGRERYGLTRSGASLAQAATGQAMEAALLVEIPL